jgi:hypothetical protein
MDGALWPVKAVHPAASRFSPLQIAIPVVIGGYRLDQCGS